VTVTVDNLLGKRQQVSNLAGITPLGYQPIYRDPLGRLVSVELRKVF
jgi:iron complex outermembrane receptor protein